MMTNAANLARLNLTLKMREGFYLLVCDLVEQGRATKEEEGAAEIRMIEAHRAVQAAYGRAA